MSDTAAYVIIGSITAVCLFHATLKRFIELVNDAQDWFWDALGEQAGWIRPAMWKADNIVELEKQWQPRTVKGRK